MHPARQLVRDVVADNLRAARARSRLKQDDVAERMRGLGFDTWSRATVSEIERGNRGVGVDELVALAVVFAEPLAGLLARHARGTTFDETMSVEAHAVDQVLRGEPVHVEWVDHQVQTISSHDTGRSG